LKKAVATEPPVDLKFDTLFDNLLQCDSHAQRECSRLGRNIVNTKGKPET